MIRIAFIVLPIPFLFDQKRNAPLGVLYCASQIEDSVVVDLRGVDRSQWLRKIPQAQIYGISSTSLDYDIALDLAHMLRADRPGRIMLGGVHATVSPSVDPVFDIVVKGEGDNIIRKIIDEITITYGPTPQLIYGRHPVYSLRDIYPAREKIGLDGFASPELIPGDRTKFWGTTIIGSRGCPYNCAFCANKALWQGRVTKRPTDQIIGEIKGLIDRYGIKHYRFHDDTITTSKKRIHELCLQLEPLGIQWRCNTRAKELDIETAKMMKDSGCVEVGFGMESASDEALLRINKKATVADSMKTVEIAKKAGIPVKVFFIVGLPGDFGDISGRFIKLMKDTEPDAVNLNTLAPFPGTDVYEHPEKYGVKFLERDFTKYRLFYGLKNHEYESPFPIEYEEMSADELKAHRKIMLDYIQEKGLNKIG